MAVWSHRWLDYCSVSLSVIEWCGHYGCFLSSYSRSHPCASSLSPTLSPPLFFHDFLFTFVGRSCWCWCCARYCVMGTLLGWAPFTHHSREQHGQLCTLIGLLFPAALEHTVGHVCESITSLTRSVLRLSRAFCFQFCYRSDFLQIVKFVALRLCDCWWDSDPFF